MKISYAEDTSRVNGEMLARHLIEKGYDIADALGEKLDIDDRPDYAYFTIQDRKYRKEGFLGVKREVLEIGRVWVRESGITIQINGTEHGRKIKTLLETLPPKQNGNISIIVSDKEPEVSRPGGSGF